LDRDFLDLSREPVRACVIGAYCGTKIAVGACARRVAKAEKMDVIAVNTIRLFIARAIRECIARMPWALEDT
jgi:hypothetical protein